MSTHGSASAHGWRYRAEQDEAQRWKWIYKHPLWEDIERMLRHRWSPRDVVAWCKREHPGGKPPPSFQTLYRFIEDKPAEWFVDSLLFRAANSPVVQRSVSRLMVLEMQSEAILALRKRIARALDLEETMQGLLMPELRANMELLNRMLLDHLKVQQQLGITPNVQPTGVGRGLATGEDDAGDDRGFLQLVRRVVELPEDQFVPMLVAALGKPPEHTQPPLVEPPRVTIEATAVHVDGMAAAGNGNDSGGEARPDPARPSGGGRR